MGDDLRLVHLRDIARTFRNYKTLGERALAQISDEELYTLVDPDSNSLAIILKHIAGNFRSRFTDFLTTDGEKSTRHRDSEFEIQDRPSRAELMRAWDEGWSIALGAIDSLTPEDLERPVYIRGEAFEVIEALNRSATHVAYHVGQIVFLAKHLAGTRWTSLSIPKNRSADYAKGEFKKGIIPRS